MIDGGNGMRPMFRFAGRAGYGAGAPARMPAYTGDGMPVRRTGDAFGQGLQNVGEGIWPADGALLLDGEFFLNDGGVLNREFELDGGAAAGGRFDLRRPGDSARGAEGAESGDIDLEPALPGAWRTDGIEDDRCGNTQADGAFHAVVRIDVGLAGSGREHEGSNGRSRSRQMNGG